MTRDDFDMAIASKPAERPVVAFAYCPEQAEGVFDRVALDRLATVCDVASFDPVDDFSSPAARSLLSTAEILVSSWGCPVVDSVALGHMPRLKLIAHAAGTVKNFIRNDVFAAGIKVCNAASVNAIPVAEFTLAAILFSNKRVLGFRDDYREQRAAPLRTLLGALSVGNFRRTIGIVGYSRIGARVIELLRPHDLDIVLHDPHFPESEARALGVTSVDLDELMARADVVSLHAPSLASTRHMIDARRLRLMRSGATFINTARGALVDQDALVAELVSGRISAVIDVTEPEVLPPDSPLYSLPNVLLTPHIAGALGNERARLGALVVSEIERFVRGLPLAHAVTAQALELQA